MKFVPNTIQAALIRLRGLSKKKARPKWTGHILSIDPKESNAIPKINYWKAQKCTHDELTSEFICADCGIYVKEF